MKHKYEVNLSDAQNEKTHQRFTGIKYNKQNTLENNILSLSEDQNGDIWMVTYQDGIYRYDGSQLHHFPVTKDGATIKLFSIYIDNSNKIWVGTHDYGPFTYDDGQFVPFVLQNKN